MLKKLKKYFQPKIIKIYNNSIYHNIKKNKKHLEIIIVSDYFKKYTLFNRHKKVYDVLSQEIQNEIYALSLHIYTVYEWNNHEINFIQKNRCQNKKY
ncbi:BolA family protein [Buchnera aphidicola]|uniref:BolA family protein n=1 Tax=Buchnera aphidicola TaxID=9 RepID=UPI0034644AF6